MKNYRYDIIGAYNEGVEEYPQDVMRRLGKRIIKCEFCPIADCWFFRVEEEIESLPSYLEKIDDDFKFWDERKNDEQQIEKEKSHI